MTLYLGDNPIAGIAQNTKYNANNLLDFKWSDHLLNDQSWLRADTFSWQSGDTYTEAYNHLVADVQGIISETETIGSYTVTFYRATDGHKICLADQEQTVLNIYNETGIAWYYILDTTNTQFKLPRTKWGFKGLRDNVGDLISQDVKLPNIAGTLINMATDGYTNSTNGCIVRSAHTSSNRAGGNLGFGIETLKIDASSSSSVYSGDGTNTNIQERATQMYLYFYVGDYTQSAIEQTAGLNSELFNSKVDLPVGRSQSSVGLLVESYVSGTSWYRVYSDGWCEQGGKVSIKTNSTSTFGGTVYWGQFTVTFIKTFTEIFNCSTDAQDDGSGFYFADWSTLDNTSLNIQLVGTANNITCPVYWSVSGYIN